MQPAPLYIVASPRPRAGKTLLARLLMEYFLDNGRPLVGFDLNPRGPVLAGRFPKLVWPVDIGDIRGQMELFDRLVADTASTSHRRRLRAVRAFLHRHRRHRLR